ncbi:MAG: hypothetical protein PHE45_09730, partial [Bacteroidales bacterium]|nr:hypothetical protein [Bacteroidales bacterium]
ERGTLIASGFIAGGALMGVVSAIIKFAGKDLYHSLNYSEILAVVAYIAIIIYMIWDCLRADKTEKLKIK